MGIREDITQVVREWVKLAGGAPGSPLPNELVLKEVRGDFKGRPSPPYFTVLVTLADSPVGVDESGHFDDGAGGVEWRARGGRLASVSVQGFGALTRDAIDDIAIRLTRPDVQSLLDAAGLTVINRGNVLDVSTFIDTEIEPRFLREFELSYDIRDSGPGAPELETVETDLTLQSPAGDRTVDIDITV